MAIELDYMEYATDAAAQAAYVSNAGYTPNQIPTMTSNTAPSGVASASTEDSAGFAAWKAMDKNTETFWNTTANTNTGWLKYQFAAAKIICQYTIMGFVDATYSPKTWTFDGSNDNTDWTTIDTQTNIAFASNEKKTFVCANSTPYLYYRLNITVNGGAGTIAIWEWEMMEKALQSFSEATLKTQGSYALKGIAAITDSLNKTLTRTIT